MTKIAPKSGERVDAMLGELVGSSLSTIEMLPIVAAFLFLRCAQHQDAELTAVAEFDGREYSPIFRNRNVEGKSDLQIADIVMKKLISSDQLFVPLSFVRSSGAEVGRKAVWNLPKVREGSIDPLRNQVERVLTYLHGQRHKEYESWVLSWFGHFDFGRTSDRVEAELLFESLLDTMMSRATGSAGEFYTPKRIVELMVELASPEIGKSIYDPCFGMGGTLVQSIRRLRSSGRAQRTRDWEWLNTRTIYGVERSEAAFIIGLARVALAGITEAGLENVDALERSTGKGETQFDIVLANPPWGAKLNDPQRYNQYRIRATTGENLFLQHIMASLRPGGRAVVVLPESALFRPGPDMKVREQLLTEFSVQSVIALPQGAFLPFSSVKSSIVVFRKPGPTAEVRFVTVPPLPQRGGRMPAEWLDVAGTVKESRSKDRSEAAWTTAAGLLRRRDFELIAKRPVDEDVERRLAELIRIDPTIEQCALASIAEVFSGVSYDKNNTVPAVGEHPRTSIPIVRVSDVRDGSLLEPELLFTDRSRADERDILRPGDVLLTTTGTIGKAALFRTHNDEAVAAKSLAVIRPGERLSGEFLVAIFESTTYRQWLTGTARGSTIQNLSIRAVRNMLVPVPEMQLQLAIVRIWNREGGDIFDLLTRSIAPERKGRAAEFRHAMRPALNIGVAAANGDGPDSIQQLETMARIVTDFRFSAADSVDVGGFEWYTEWARHIQRALKPVRGITEVEAGPARYAILQGANADLRSTLHVLVPSPETADPDVEPLFTSCRDLSLTAGILVDTELKRLLSKVEIRATIEPARIVVGPSAVIHLKLTNSSALPLREIIAISEPPIGRFGTPYLAEGAEASIALSPSEEQLKRSGEKLDMRLHWTARRIDGTFVEGDVAVSIGIIAQGESPSMAADLGASPYIVGKPVDSKRGDVFFGRKDVIDRIVRQLSNEGQSNVVLLEGNRRTGKTSILKQLESHPNLSGWLIANCSLQGGESDKMSNKEALPTAEVFRLMAEQIGWAASRAKMEVWPPNAPPTDPNKRFVLGFSDALKVAFGGDQPFKAFELYIREVMEKIAPKRLLVLLDEFDILQVGIDAGVTSPMVPQNLRYLLHTYPEFSVVISSTHRIRRLREEYWSALFGLGYSIPLEPIKVEDARQLVTKPVAGRLIYVDDARELLISLTGRQPFLIQSLCNRVFDIAAETDVRLITVDIVDAAAAAMVVNNEHFATLWDYAATERRRVLLWLITRGSSAAEPVTYSILESQLEQNRIVVPRGDRIADDLDALIELELIEVDEAGAYKITVPIFGTWIKKHRPFESQVAKAVDEAQRRI